MTLPRTPSLRLDGRRALVTGASSGIGLGCAVALIKVADLAQVMFGPAFWMFALLVILVLLQQRYLCSWSVWDALNTPTQ